MKIAFIKEYTGRRLTWLSRVLIAILLVAALYASFRNVYGFLAINQPPHEGVLVVEGWIHDFALDEAAALYRTGNYSHIICTGTPIETGSYIQSFKSYPEMTYARLVKLGIDPANISTAISDEWKKDRTHAAATALREHLMAHNIEDLKLHLVTVGAHSRRSQFLFQKALGSEYIVGVSSLEDMSYSPKDWHKCSQGVRSTLSELIAYIYARFFFHP